MTFREYLEEKKNNKKKDVEGELEPFIDADDDDEVDKAIEIEDEEEPIDYIAYIDDIIHLIEDDDIEITDEMLDEATMSPLQRRRINRIKRTELNKKTDGQFFNWKLADRARFLSKWQFMPLPGFKGKFVLRSKPIPVPQLIKKLKKAAKVMKQSKFIRKAGQRVKSRTKGKN